MSVSVPYQLGLTPWLTNMAAATVRTRTAIPGTARVAASEAPAGAQALEVRNRTMNAMGATLQAMAVTTLARLSRWNPQSPIRPKRTAPAAPARKTRSRRKSTAAVSRLWISFMYLKIKKVMMAPGMASKTLSRSQTLLLARPRSRISLAEMRKRYSAPWRKASRSSSSLPPRRGSRWRAIRRPRAILAAPISPKAARQRSSKAAARANPPSRPTSMETDRTPKAVPRRVGAMRSAASEKTAGTMAPAPTPARARRKNRRKPGRPWGRAREATDAAPQSRAPAAQTRSRIGPRSERMPDTTMETAERII